MDFTGKVVLVTGGGSGIGRAAACAFARRGAFVVVAGRREAQGQETVALIEAAGGSGRFVKADVTSAAEIEHLHQVVARHSGRLDVAFDNAGYQEPRALIAEQDPSLFDRVFDTNLRSAYLCLQHQLRLMAESGGAIVLNASVSGLRNPNPGLALYSASKAAVISLMRSAAIEYAGKGIRINAVAPGRVVTDMMLSSKISSGFALRRWERSRSSRRWPESAPPFQERSAGCDATRGTPYSAIRRPGARCP